MATCLVTVGGTYGEVLIKYVDSGSTPHSLISGPGTFYLDDTGSDYTYSVVYGDVTVTSLCITFTNLPYVCYVINWGNSLGKSLLSQFKVQSIIAGSLEYSLYIPTDMVLSSTLAHAINNIGDYNITCQSFKHPNQIIVKTLTPDVPYIKLSDSATSFNIYLKGQAVANCVPSDFEQMDVWPNIPATTTTTSTTSTTTSSTTTTTTVVPIP